MMNLTAYPHRLWLALFSWLSFSALPLSVTAAPSCIDKDLVIALDIGHSPAHPGAISARGVEEYDFNRKIAYKLKERLIKQGFTKTFIVSAANPEMPLHARASFANAKQADLLISLHHDSVQPHYLYSWMYEGTKQHYSDRFQGYSLFISGENPNYEASLQFADLLGDELRSLDLQPTLHHAEAIVGENRPLLNKEKGIYRYDDLVILKNSKMPALLMECGVIVHRQEEELLTSNSYQQNLIAALERAILRFAEQPLANGK